MNAFLQVADSQQNAASKARDRGRERRLDKLVVKSEADAPMVASAADKQMFENSQLLKNYRRHLRVRREDLLAGPHGREVGALLQLLESISASSAGALVIYIERAGWLQQADADTKHGVLSLVGTAIARHRVRNGLSPFDDSVPYTDEPPTAFQKIRKLITGVGADL